MKTLILGNMTNGLVYPHDSICQFQSQYAHHYKLGYFKHDSMPLDAVVHLLLGGKLQIVDATQHNKKYSDALRAGVPTWALVFNRALGFRETKVCEWQTPHMLKVANSNVHRVLVSNYRKLIKLYGSRSAIEIGDDKDISLVCYSSIDFDDKPEVIKSMLYRKELT